MTSRLDEIRLFMAGSSTDIGYHS